jgi:MFS family permease
MSNLSSIRKSLDFMRGNILILTITRVLGQFCRSMVFPYASLYILALGGEPAQIGQINALMPLAGLFLFPIAGYITDYVGRVKLIGYSGFLSGAILLLYIIAPSWHWLALAALLRGTVILQFPATSAIMADSLTPQNRGIGMATMNTFGGLLAIISPYLAGALLDATGVEWGMRVLYGVMMAFYTLSAAINLRFLRETSAPAEPEFGWADLPRAFKAAYGGIPTLLRRFPRSLRAMSVVLILCFVANAIAGPFWVVYASDQLGLSSATWGLTLLVETVLRNVAFMPAGALVDRYGRTRFLIASLLLALVSVPLFAWSRTWVQVLVLRCLVAVATAFFMPACSALLADVTPREMRGRVMAAIGRGTVMIGASSGGTGGPGVGFLLTGPIMIASLIGGYIYAANPRLPWILSAAALGLSTLLAALFIRDPEAAEA